MSEEVVLTVSYEVSQKASNIWGQEGSTFRPHSTIDREHVSTSNQERIFLYFIIIWQVSLSSFHYNFIKIPSHTHTQFNTAARRTATYFSELQNGICRMSQRNDKGTSLAQTKRTMFPLGHYRTILFQGGKAVKINTKQSWTCRMTVCGEELKETIENTSFTHYSTEK